MSAAIARDATPPVSEAKAFFAALDAVSPAAVTACVGWTAHEIAAHLAAGTAEIARLFEAVLAGEPVPETRPFAEREPAFRALPDAELRERMVREGERYQRARRALAPTTVVRFTGWDMTPALFATHSRSELALHRWDLVGSDDLSRSLLAQPELTEHAVKALNALERIQEWPTARARRAGWGADTRSYALRTPGHPDVILRWHEGRASLDIGDGRALPGLETDAAARFLLLWGRRPMPEHGVVTDLDPEGLRQLQACLFV